VSPGKSGQYNTAMRLRRNDGGLNNEGFVTF
jgi:hypothetical protein